MKTIVRRNHNPIARRSDVFDRFFEDAWRNLPFNEFNNNENALALDVQENDTAYTIQASLPGVNADDIDIRLHDGVLTISGESKFEDVEEGTRHVIRERRYGTFSRSLRFPIAVDADAIEANYENGILSVSVPKAEEAKPRQITVKATSGNGSAS